MSGMAAHLEMIHHSLLVACLTVKVVMHTCNNMGCMNPSHLMVGSTQENNVEDYTKLHVERHTLLVARAAAVE
jgi:hypothetical protein